MPSAALLTGTGMLATMAPGLSYAIAAKLAYPDRPSVAVVGDGGFAMLMAELTTAVANKLPVKVVISRRRPDTGYNRIEAAFRQAIAGESD